MKGSTREPIPGFAQHDDARFAFLDAVNRELSATAFEELRGLAQRDPDGDLDAIETWAKKWGVDAPFVRLAAKQTVESARRDPHNISWQFPVWRTQPLPEAWRYKMATLNQLPVRFTSLDDGVASGTMKVPDPKFGPDAFQVVAAPLERLLEQDHVLAPIATDPCRESLDAFLQRARHHRQARAQLATRDGLTPVALKPDLARDMDWLVRYQIHEESFSAISRGAKVTADAVRKAVHRLAELLDLQLRQPPRGRPRRSRK